MKLSLAVDVITTTFIFLPTFAKTSEKDGIHITGLHRDLKGNLVGRNLSTDTDWTQVGITLEGEKADDWFGNSVSMSKKGMRMAVGAYAANNVSGSVKVYDIIDNSLKQIGDDINGNRDEENIFQYGRVVSMSDDGSRVAIAAPGGSGGVVVYEWDFTDTLGQWNRIGGIVPVWSPMALAMSGDGNRFVAGSSGRKGVAFVYEWFDDHWKLIGEVNGKADNENFACYGVAMSYDGKRFIAGAPYVLYGNPDQGAGTARIYKEIDTNKWEQVGIDLKPAELGVSGDEFGYSVDMSKAGNRVVVGSPGAGSSYVYNLVKDSTWKLVWDEVSTDNFGYAVSISDDGKRFAAGRYYGGASAYVFEERIHGWDQVGNNIDGSYSFGAAISLSSDGMNLAVGGPQVNSKAGIAALYTSPYPLCRNSQLQMILRTSDGDTVPFNCKQASKFKAGFSCDKKGDLASHCPSACGACSEYQCSDSEASFLVGKNKNERNCAWLEKMKPSKRSVWCSKRFFADTCRKTCNICGGE